MRETRVRSLGREDPLEKEMATRSSILAWRIPWTEEPGGLQSMGSQKVGHDWTTSLSLSYFNKFFLIFLNECKSSKEKKYRIEPPSKYICWSPSHHHYQYRMPPAHPTSHLHNNVWLYLEIGPLKKQLWLNEVIEWCSNPKGLVSVSGMEEMPGTGAHTKERSCEDTERRQLPASQGERPEEKPNLQSQHFCLEPPASRTVRNKFLLFKPPDPWSSVMVAL